MGLYDNYQLANSSLVKQYAGSSVPALLNVGQVMEDRFNSAREGYDLLGSAVDNSRIYEGDRKMFDETMGKHRQAIAEAAKSGDYENMLYAANKSGRQFANDYRPFAENYQAVQGFYGEVDKALEKGTLKSPETAAKLKQLGMQGYAGLQKDPTTGKLVGRFQGIGIAKEIDVPQKIDEWMKNFAPRITGGSVEQIEGDYYVTRGGKRTRLTQGEINNVLNSAMALDPEWKAYKQQKVALDSLGYDTINPESLPADNPTRMAIQAEADRQGISFGKAFKQAKEGSVESELLGNVRNFASKYKRDDVESDYKINETEAAGRNAQKKIDDAETTFGVPIIIPKTGSEFSSPDKIEQGISGSNESIKKIGENWSAYVNVHKLKKVGDKYVRPDGVDVTNTAMRHQLLMTQEKNKRDQLLKLNNEAKAAANYTVSQADLKRANQAFSESMATSTSMAPGAVPMSQDEKRQQAQVAYDNALKDTPNYIKYQNELKKRTADMSMQTIATRFQNKSDNTAIENLINNMSTSDGDANMLGLEYTGSKKGGQQLSADDYQKVKGKIGFAGQAMNDKGEQVYIFKAQGEKGENMQFQMKGIVSNKNLPTLIGADSRQFYSQQFLRSATSNPSGEVTTELIPGTFMKVKVPAGSSNTYKLELKGNGGGKAWEFDSEDELTSKLSAILQQHAGH